MAKARCPYSRWSSPRSSRISSAMAVADMASASPATSEELAPHRYELAKLELEPDHEEEHHHAELGDRDDALRCREDAKPRGSDDDPADEIGDDRRKPELARDGHAEHGGDEQEKPEDQEAEFAELLRHDMLRPVVGPRCRVGKIAFRRAKTSVHVASDFAHADRCRGARIPALSSAGPGPGRLRPPGRRLRELSPAHRRPRPLRGALRARFALPRLGLLLSRD